MMKKYYILIFLIPIIIVVAVNEYTRTMTNGFVRKGVKTMHPYQKDVEKCSWYCHSDTQYCKRAHTKSLKKHTTIIDPFYFGIIKSLHNTGNYGLANIIFLVVLFPLLMYVLLIKIILIQRNIKKLKNE